MGLKSFLAKVGTCALVVCAILVASSSLHNISYAKLSAGWDSNRGTAWAAEQSAAKSASATKPPDPAHPDTATEAQLKAALQKRLLVPNPGDLSIGAPSPGPFPGTISRTVTINGPDGQKFEVEYFSNTAGDRGVLAQRFALFDLAHPWEHAEMKTIHLDNRATLGPADAPIQVVEFADFECPYCARAFTEVETLVNTTYKGRVRLTWKNFPLGVHPWAEQAAIAAECVRQQNPAAFWTVAGDFYHDQSDITVQNLRDHIYGYAKTLGLDSKALNACILGKDAEARVAEDKKDGAAIHLNSTPTFLVNGIPVVGLPSSNVFDFVITSQLHERNAAR